MSRTLLILFLTANVCYGQTKADLKKLDSATIKYYATTISAIKYADQKVRRDPINDALLRYTDSVNYLRYMQLIDSVGFLNNSYFANDEYASSQDILIIHYSIIHTMEMLRAVEKAAENRTATINDLANVYTYYLTRMYQTTDTSQYVNILLIGPIGKYRDIYEDAIARFISHIFRKGPVYFAILPVKSMNVISQREYNDLKAFYTRLAAHKLTAAPLFEVGLQYLSNNHKWNYPGLPYEKDYWPTIKYVLVLNRKIMPISFYRYED